MKRNRILAIGLLAALALAAAGCGKKTEKKVLTPGDIDPSSVVIWVDGAGITHGMLRADMARLARGVPPNLPEEQMQRINTQILLRAIDDLVVRQLIRGEYERSGVAIPQDDVEAAKKSMFRTPEELASRLADSNMTVAQLEDNLKLDIFRNMMVKDALAEETAKLDDNSAREYYDANIQMFTKPAGRMASHIFVRVPADADDEAKAAARTKAEQVRRSLLEGADFASLAVEVSDAPDRAMGGQLGIVVEGAKRLAEPIETAVYAQPVGEIGEIVESPAGFHVIKVTSIEEEEVLPFDTVKGQILAQLRLQIQHRLGAEFVAKLRDRANIRFDGALESLNRPAQPEGEAAEGAAEGGEEAAAGADAAEAEPLAAE